jgi:Phage integrase family
VFASQADGVIDQSNLMARVLKPAAVRAGLGEWVVSRGKRIARTWVGFHTMRHSCASIHFRRGWNAKQVQMLLGHHSPAVTQEVYVHSLPSDLPEPSFLDEITAPVATEEARRHPEIPGNGEGEPEAETAEDAGGLLLQLPAASAS